ncbi:MAG TPA: peptidase [Oxalobacteraceae bacterium]|nr:peptidase [Oxalobacteraceae bacterium]
MPSQSPVPLLANPLVIGLFNASVRAGFPSPAADHAQKRIDLNEHLFINRESSFLFRVMGDSMINIGIFEGDTIIVDRAIEPRHRHIVLAIVDEEFTVKRFYRRGKVVRLLAENPAYPPIELSEGQELRIWGVVTFNLHKLLNG